MAWHGMGIVCFQIPTRPPLSKHRFHPRHTYTLCRCLRRRVLRRGEPPAPTTADQQNGSSSNGGGDDAGATAGKGGKPNAPRDSEQQERRTEEGSDASESSLDGDGLNAPLLLRAGEGEGDGEGGEGYECDEADPLPPGCWLSLARCVFGTCFG